MSGSMESIDLGTQCLKSGDTVFVTGSEGQMRPETGAVGLFHEGTRYLSRWELTLSGLPPIPLRASADLDAVELSVDATCQTLGDLRAGDVHLSREVLLESGHLYERLRLNNQTPQAIRISIELAFDADFADLFEVRGNERPHRGRYSSEVLGTSTVAFSYEGLDRVTRTLHLSFDTVPARITRNSAVLEFELLPRKTEEIKISLLCTSLRASVPHTGPEPDPPSYPAQWPEFDSLLNEILRRRRAHTPQLNVESSNATFDSALTSARTDLAMLISERPTGPYPMAGIPWFATPFGRDGIITALQNLWWHPELSKGVLRFLALRQATEDDPARDSEPGKILHEERLGEMAALGEVPYGRYYGSVDSTPLFVLLAGRYFRTTGDKAFIESIWPNLNLAMLWIENYGDFDGDGFVEYGRRSKDGLIQQGWKDSHDSVFYADGTMVEGPVALCEVQAYVYEAYVAMEVMAVQFEGPSTSAAWGKKARTLKSAFDAAFFDAELGTYCLALDGKKNPCRVRSSNAGHCLFTGLALPERAERLKEDLLSSEMFCGWGIRTLASNEQRYNPISYHNGSVWPHDNSLIAAGLSRYGFFEAADQILHGTLALASHRQSHRLPELVCGFSSRRRGGPVPYPSACAPQAWAAGSLWLMLQASLGLEVVQGELVTNRLRLPTGFMRLALEGIATSTSTFSVLLERHHEDELASVTVERADREAA